MQIKISRLITCLLLCNTTATLAQNLELKDLTVPNSPAFTILDISPKVIDRPGTAKALSTNIVSLLTESNGLPKNFSIEVAPFWFFKNKLNAYSYLGIDSATGRQSSIFCNMRNASISVGSIYKDSSKSLPFSANYLAAGFRINPIKFVNNRVIQEFKRTVDSIAGLTAKKINHILDSCARAIADPTSQAFKDCVAKGLELALKDPAITNLEKKLENLTPVKPIFLVDIAGAGSWTFKENSFSNDHHYRTGIWTTMELNLPLTNTKDINKLIENKNYFSLYGKLRFMREDSTLDYKQFNRYNLLDIGGRLEFTLDRLSISFETIHRVNQTNKQLNTDRNVGILEYKVNDKLFISGSFGKNFGSVNNVVALFGINWGLGKEAINKLGQQ